MSDWLELERELDCWPHSGRPATFWWRDDDADSESESYTRLLDISESYALPLGLAVVPATMTPGFVKRLSGLGERVEVLQHGFAHRNHAARNEKKTEFGEHRSLDVMRDEIIKGAKLLRAAAGERFLAVFVPPWNRIAPAVTRVLPELGFVGVSAFGRRPCGESVPGLRQANTHVDLIDWKAAGRGFRGERKVLADMIAHLRDRRDGDADEATGVLTHHRVHDQGCWRFLERLFDLTRRRAEVRWIGPNEALAD
ncbi:MAG: polysaccharide deacetylase family protein [Gammaproteobacteria bacterium]|nr:polysaccharide deacetylase family protein [Gammaproteobacteria bacterium]